MNLIVAVECIVTMKKYIDEGLVNQDLWSIIHQEVLDYMLDKGIN